MLDLSNAAGAQLQHSLKSAQLPESEKKCFRVVPKDDSALTLKLATPAPSDSTFEYAGKVVLAVPEALGPFFEDKTLDVDREGQLKLI